jgi:predicted small secreted protein
MKKLVFALLALTLVLAACSSPSGAVSGAPKAVEDYLTALVGQDADKISTLSCADWEETALLELDSFQGVTARVDAPACAETGTEGDASLVTCTGKIIATYNNEDQELPLDSRVYKVVQEGGNWLVCGYQE